MFMADRLEHQWYNDEDVLVWDVRAWIGSDYYKFYLESEGEKLTDKAIESADLELFLNRTLNPFWDLQLGIRHDFQPSPSRTFLAFGFQGLAPYWFEVDATAYVSEDGDVSAAMEAEYDILLSQRLIFQPRFEIALAIQDVPEYGIGSGINDIELGVRLRYEIRREFAPYIGVSWHRKIGQTADMARDENEDIESGAFIAGVRMWF
ncbi:MAG: copper resistance protein B [Proteobacteria bacterium]|nr:copper resistance protein B [Pseudomonadota bacterium]MBU4470585.1 copper resistance protein B [Pseudomonadota bacterium]